MTSLTGLDRFYYWYFVIHIPITVIIDSTLVIPSQWQLPVQKLVVSTHIQQNNDFMLEILPFWLKVFGAFELFVQLPIFVVSIVKYHQKSLTVLPILIVYGFNAFLTTLVCLVYVALEGPNQGLSPFEVGKLQLIYLPYLIIPFIMLIDGFNRTTALIESYQVYKLEKKDL